MTQPSNTQASARLVFEILKELNRARQKFPMPNLNMCALTEEVGELAQALLHTRFGGRCAGWPNVRKEAVQVAVMAMRVALEGDPSIATPEEFTAPALIAENVRSPERFDGRATWTELSAEQQAEIGAIALELVVAWHGVDASADEPAATPEMRAFEAADRLLYHALMEAVTDALHSRAPGALDDYRIPIPAMLGPICRACGCSEDSACEGGCSWVEADLCSSCAKVAL